MKCSFRKFGSMEHQKLLSRNAQQKLFRKILQTHRKSLALVSPFNKVTKLWPGTLIEKGTPAHLFSCKFPASILNSLFVKHVNDYLCNMQRYYNSISRMMFSKQYSQSLSIVTLKGELPRC